ncbi:MAG: class I SAM-dependent methyltransferase [Planctomycetes bacterium]|nr:class I SAM-dependent methyltransferase [Planctomycetota bacterium]
MSGRPSLKQRLFARLMRSADGISEAMYRDRKRALFADLRGRVLELGPGTGVNLGFFDPTVEWIGIEPNVAMHAALHEKARADERVIELRSLAQGRLDLPDESVDHVVSTLVLCSVPDVEATLREVHRVLRPGGRYVFIEHVVDPRNRLRRCVQRAVPYTPWRYFSDGCRPARDLGRAIDGAGFETVEQTSYEQGGPGLIMAVCRPHIAGWARKSV